MRILVIEDTPADFMLLERHLRKHGVEAECLCVSSDGELDAALQQPWDVVLSDYNVPGMHFRDTLQRIREFCPDLPVILVSGRVGEETAVELLRLGRISITQDEAYGEILLHPAKRRKQEHGD